MTKTVAAQQLFAPVDIWLNYDDLPLSNRDLRIFQNVRIDMILNAINVRPPC